MSFEVGNGSAEEPGRAHRARPRALRPDRVRTQDPRRLSRTAISGETEMKLYLTPHACSLAVDIVARELGIPLDLEWVDVRAKRLRDGSDYFAVNPKGQVPTLELADGQFLTEGPVIVQYLADVQPGSGLLAAPGDAWSDTASSNG